MLLAGGQGSRLLALTKKNAKPAVAFGGKYRIIDFSLSNCVNSGIDTVGVLTQYRPMILNRYLGNGEAWDLDTPDGGVHVLPPYATEAGGRWYNGTADAIYRNIDFIDNYDPEYVVILSGDHLYKMDYNEMLEFHKERNADLTVSVIPVPWEEASRFGVMSVDDDKNITRFAEKPKEPESNLASMGLYIFNWDVLRRALEEDHVIADSDHDFGKNLIPKLLGEGKKLCAYTGATGRTWAPSTATIPARWPCWRKTLSSTFLRTTCASSPTPTWSRPTMRAKTPSSAAAWFATAASFWERSSTPSSPPASTSARTRW